MQYTTHLVGSSVLIEITGLEDEDVVIWSGGQHIGIGLRKAAVGEPVSVIINGEKRVIDTSMDTVMDNFKKASTDFYFGV